MADLIKKVKVMQTDGTFTDYIPLGADAANVKTEDGMSVENKLKKKPYYFDTVADMKAATYLKADDMAVTLGYYEVNDGGGAEYKIVQSSDEYVETLNNNLKAELIIKKEVNIKQFGAYGDGTHDDSLAFQTAINAYSIIQIPKGNFKITSRIHILELDKMYGWGKESIISILPDPSLEPYSTAPCLSFEEVDNFILKDFVVADIYETKSRFVNNIQFTTCTEGKIENLEIKNCCGTGLFFWKYCKNILIKDCYIHDTWADGIHIQRGSQNFMIEHCHFDKNQDDCIGFITHGGEEYGQCKGLYVNNCLMENTLVAGSGVCCDGSQDITIVNNTIRNTQWGGIRINRMREDAQSSWFYPNNVFIENNLIKNTGLGGTDVASAITFNTSGGAIIKNNIIDTVTLHGINMSGCLGEIIVKGNKIKNTDETGILITASTAGTWDTCFNVEIEGNFLSSIGTSGIMVTDNNNTSLNEEQIAVNILNNTLNQLNTSNVNNAVGITGYSTRYVRIYNNIIKNVAHTLQTTYGVSGSKDSWMYGNFPITVAEKIILGGKTHILRGEAPTTGVAGDVVWNWNPGSGIAFWICTTGATDSANAVYKPVRWDSN